MNSDIVALVSVITSGIVAVSHVLVPLINDQLKHRRERKIAEAESINGAATAVLGLLAVFRSGDVHTASKKSIKQVYAETLAAYYRWERKLPWSIKAEMVERIAKLRKGFESGNYNSLYKEGPSLADEINTITDLACKKL